MTKNERITELQKEQKKLTERVKEMTERKDMIAAAIKTDKAQLHLIDKELEGLIESKIGDATNDHANDDLAAS